jgi:hypothetical protein
MSASASAKLEHSFLGAFGSASKPLFSHAEGLAVDQVSGDLLVIDAGAKTVSRWHSDGTPANFTALGSNVIDAKGKGECPTVLTDCDQTPQNGFEFQNSKSVQIVIDGSGGITNGNIYITQAKAHLIDIFSADGSYLGQLTKYFSNSEEKPLGEACGVAVDANGAVYIGDFNNSKIHKFVPSVNPPLTTDNVASFTSVTNPCTLAAGVGPTSGFLFINRWDTGALVKLSSSNGAPKYPIGSAIHWTASADPVTGHVYGMAHDGKEVIEYDASGGGGATVVYTIQPIGKPEGVAIDGTSGTVYVSRESSSSIDVYGPLKQPSPRVRAWTESVGLTDATLEGQINPKGVETTYHFEWGADTSYGNSTTETVVGSDESDHDVSLDLNALTQGATYHWRLVARNECAEGCGVTESSDRTFTTYDPLVSGGQCSNQEFRVGFSEHLPDCRSYEMVSPLNKNGGDIIARSLAAGLDAHFGSFRQSSPTGERITYSSNTAFGDALSGPVSNQYLSNRGKEGWVTHGISPPRGTAIFELEHSIPIGNWDLETPFDAFTPDLCSAWLKDTNVVPLTPNALAGYVNLYRRSNCGAEGFEALTIGGPFGESTKYLNGTGPPVGGGNGPGLRFQGYSAGLLDQLFLAGAALTSNAATVPGNKSQLYNLHDGELKLVSVLPNGEANPNESSLGTLGSAAQNRQSSLEHAVSQDGLRVFWTASTGIGAGKIYLRLNPARDETKNEDGEGNCIPDPALACTISVSESGEELSDGSVSRYWNATPDGSEVLFSTNGDLYRFDVDRALANEVGATTLVAHQVTGVLGASDDLSRIYLASKEDLAEGATAGAWNLYVDDGGVKTFIATLTEVDVGEVAGKTPPTSFLPPHPVSLEPIIHASRVTPDGKQIAFQSLASLSGYDNLDPVSGLRYTEVYRYDADSHELSCVSCNPSGVRPSGSPLLFPYSARTDLPISQELDEIVKAAAILPTCEREQHCSQALTDDGDRIFFQSYEALVPVDTNGAQDVYEWEEAASRVACEDAGAGLYVESSGGCLSLISTGTSPQASEFIDASADGSDVFISTSSAIDPRDEGLVDVYDAREGGGFSLPPVQETCEEETCQSPSAPPGHPTPASAALAGDGNAEEPPRLSCPRGKRRAKVHGKARCVKRHHRKSKQHRANHNRRAGR